MSKEKEVVLVAFEYLVIEGKGEAAKITKKDTLLAENHSLATKQIQVDLGADYTMDTEISVRPFC